jgi:hypothetical protein
LCSDVLANRTGVAASALHITSGVVDIAVLACAAALALALRHLALVFSHHAWFAAGVLSITIVCDSAPVLALCALDAVLLARLTVVHASATVTAVCQLLGAYSSHVLARDTRDAIDIAITFVVTARAEMAEGLPFCLLVFARFAV